jgi:hypothetical protein
VPHTVDAANHLEEAQVVVGRRCEWGCRKSPQDCFQELYDCRQRTETASEVVCSKTLVMMTHELTWAEIPRPLGCATYTVCYCTTQCSSVQSKLKPNSWETDSHSAGHRIPTCWNPEVNYHVHGSVTLPYSEPAKSNQHPHVLFLWDRVDILLSRLFLCGCSAKIQYAFLQSGIWYTTLCAMYSRGLKSVAHAPPRVPPPELIK